MVKVKRIRPLNTLDCILRSSHGTMRKKRSSKPTTIKWGRNELLVIPYRVDNLQEIVADVQPIVSTSKKQSILHG